MTQKKLIQTGRFKGVLTQPLKNVLFYSPVIVWVNQGRKRLWWHEQTLSLASSDWLVVPASHYLTFVNEPEQAPFYSRTLTFYEPPPADWVTLSAEKSANSLPKIPVTSALAYCFDTLYSMAEKQLSYDTQKQLLYALYAELMHAGALHRLFPYNTDSLKERVAHYFSSSPGDEHPLREVAGHFLMSRATFTRKLAAEGTTFRQVLTNVRMIHALNLLQNNPGSQLSVAVACGYQSEARFSSRFRQTFGLTPREYLNTL